MKRRAFPSAPALEHLEPRQLLAFVLWDGGGGDNDWDNPLNWSADALPGAADNVIIDVAGSPTIHRSHNTTATIASLWSLDALNLSDGTLNISGQWKQSAPLFMSGGHVNTSADIIINGEALWIGGSITGNGNVLVYPGHQLTIDGDVTLGRSLYNNGSLRWASGNLTTNGGTIQNLSGRTFTILSTGTLASAGAPTTLINYGTLAREGTGTTTISTRFSNFPSWVTIDPFPPLPPPPGVVDVRGGTLAFTGNVLEKHGDQLDGYAVWKVSSSTAKLLLPGPDILSADGGTFYLSGPGASFPQLEHIASVNDLTLANGRAFTFTGLMLPGSVRTLTIDSPSLALSLPRLNVTNLIVRAGDVTLAQGITGTAITVDAPATLTLRGDSYFSYASFSGAGLIRIAGSAKIIGGDISGPGQLLITPTGSITNVGQYYESGAIFLSRRTVNYGTITLSQSYFSYSVHSLSAELVNRGTIDLGLQGYISTVNGTPGYITNFGSLNASIFGSLTLRGAGGGVRLTNYGSVHVLSGSLVLNGGAYGGGSWVVESGAESAFGGLGSNLAGPAFAGAGRIRQAAAATWSNVIMSGPGEMVNTVPASLTLTGTDSITRSSFRNDGRLSLAAGATAAFVGNVYNNAELNLGTGLINITGDFNLGVGSRLTSTSTSASNPARINVSGNMDLKGALVVTFTWNAAPGFYDFINTAHHSGGFSSTMGVGLPPGTFLLFQFFGTAGKFSVATL